MSTQAITTTNIPTSPADARLASTNQPPDPTSAESAEVIIPTGTTLDNLLTVIGFSYRFRSVWDERELWREPIKKLKADFGVRQGCAGKRMQIGEKTYSWEEFCLHYFNLSVRRVNELLIEITDDDLPEFNDNHESEKGEEESADEYFEKHFPDTTSADDKNEEEEKEAPATKTKKKRKAKKRKESTNPRLHPATSHRAIKADLCDQLIPLITNRPPEVSKEQAYNKLLDMAVVFCEDHPDLAAKFRVPDAGAYKTTVEWLRHIMRHQRDQISELGRERSELRQQLAALKGEAPSPDYPIVTEGATHKLASTVLEPLIEPPTSI
ncbi:MAG TPA: hypothetical protein VE957_10280 [Terriglobales bacterium]|nr:hypothetical protein [Terriglobales bacterium]